MITLYYVMNKLNKEIKISLNVQENLIFLDKKNNKISYLPLLIKKIYLIVVKSVMN